jgi:hypothetical protein
MRGLKRAGCKDEFSAISWVKNTGHGNGPDSGKTLHRRRALIQQTGSRSESAAIFGITIYRLDTLRCPKLCIRLWSCLEVTKFLVKNIGFFGIPGTSESGYQIPDGAS